MLCTILIHNHAQQTYIMLSTTHDLIALCRFVVEFCKCAQFFTLCKTHAQQIVHNCSKSEQFMHKCTIAQCCALAQYYAYNNCASWPRVLTNVNIYVVQHCAIVHYFKQFVPTLKSLLLLSVLFKSCFFQNLLLVTIENAFSCDLQGLANRFGIYVK